MDDVYYLLVVGIPEFRNLLLLKPTSQRLIGCGTRALQNLQRGLNRLNLRLESYPGSGPDSNLSGDYSLSSCLFRDFFDGALAAVLTVFLSAALAGCFADVLAAFFAAFLARGAACDGIGDAGAAMGVMGIPIMNWSCCRLAPVDSQFCHWSESTLPS